MLIEEEYFPPADDWSDVGRLWPPTELPLDPSIPHSVSESVEEARKCFRAKAYSACAVMCGRALEDICVEFKTKKLLAGGLQELRDRKIIDITILEWGDALRKHRNLGAHSSGVKITKEDAIDLLDFTLNIVEYVFVLKKKFSDFMDRQKQARAKASAGKSDGENGS
jgi:hypothetical protein